MRINLGDEAVFLMHRVELKDLVVDLHLSLREGFLMHRVELKEPLFQVPFSLLQSS